MRFGRDEVAGRRPRQRRLEVLTPDSGPSAYQLRGSWAWNQTIPNTTAPTNAGIAQSQPPLDPRPGQPMQPVQPRRHQRASHVQPVDRVAGKRLPQIEAADAHQQHARHQHCDRHGEQRIADAHRAAIAARCALPTCGPCRTPQTARRASAPAPGGPGTCTGRSSSGKFAR